MATTTRSSVLSFADDNLLTKRSSIVSYVDEPLKRSSVISFPEDTPRSVCAICEERFRALKILPCLHTFCVPCLKNYLETLPNAEIDFPCPMCQTIIPAPRRDISPEDWVWHIKSHQRRLSLVESEVVLDEIDRKCDPCKEMEEFRDATNYCQTCKEALCGVCTRTHRGMRITRLHSLIPIQDSKSHQMQLLQADEPCADHPGNTMNMYCQDHFVPCCNTCVAVTHRRCQNVVTMDKLAKALKQSKAGSGLITRMKQCLTAIEAVGSKKTVSQQHLLGQKEEVLKKMGNFKMNLTKVIDDLERQFANDVENLYSEQTDLINMQVDKTSRLERALKSSISTLRTIMKSGSDAQLVLSIHNLSGECDRYERLVDEDRINFREFDFKFVPNEDLETMFKGIHTLGVVEVMQKKVLGNLQSSTAKKEGIINVKIPGDKDNCIINSIDITEDGDFLLSDYNNAKVKLFDQYGIFRSSVKLDSGPRGVAYLYERKVAVSLPDQNMIKMLSIEGKYLVHYRDIYTQFKTYRLAYYGNQKMVAICYAMSSKSLTVINPTGGVERHITKKRDFKGLGGVCFDSIKSYVYVSDRDSISAYNYSGKQVFRNTYGRADLRGMCCDFQGNMYVCSRDARQILQISADGRLVKTIVVPLSPQDIAIEPMGNKIAVCGLGNLVHLYRLL
ncbi:hypothetical protein ACJMK2_010500 [Sinanodonta woodiana]|uniref:Uncharacterized protein n=1 Tax=Sinanodonta woodiana TaxID=1069815 RepID=A0ABD3VFK2_SINWO